MGLVQISATNKDLKDNRVIIFIISYLSLLCTQTPAENEQILENDWSFTSSFSPVGLDAVPLIYSLMGASKQVLLQLIWHTYFFILIRKMGEKQFLYGIDNNIH